MRLLTNPYTKIYEIYKFMSVKHRDEKDESKV